MARQGSTRYALREFILNRVTPLHIPDLKVFGTSRGIILEAQKTIMQRAVEIVRDRYGYDVAGVKMHFDELLAETERTAYDLYRREETEYGRRLMQAFALELQAAGVSNLPADMGRVLGDYFLVFDRFFLSLAQSRKSRAGKSFELIHNTLFKQLDYPFDEQAVIDGKPDFVMPSVEYYRENPLACVVFTSKRTVRERWRQITTEGTRGIGLYLATIDEGISQKQLDEMKAHKIFLVCPEAVRCIRYPAASNVLSFARFFEDHLDPKMRIWRREGLI